MKEIQTIIIIVTVLLWIIVTAYWIISSKTISSKEHRGNEIFSFIKLIGSSLIIYLPLLTGGFIAAPFFLPSLITAFIGLILCFFGIIIMMRARQFLGKNWSGNVILQKEHLIIKDGPYKYVRHPMYSGDLLAMFGSAIIVGQIFGIVWTLFCASGLIMKIKKEEKLLAGKFPDDYSFYKQQTKMLIPFIW